jgi:D-xylose ABC transporter substrate-binding protein
MKTKIIIILVALLTALLFCECSKKIKIGLLMDSLEQERWAKDRDIFTSKIKELGGETIYRLANGDADKQLEQARELIDNGVHLLVVIPVDQDKAADIVKLAHKNHVRVLSYDRLIKNCNLDFYISFDNVDVGRLQAEYLTKICPAGNFAIIGGAITDNNSFLLKLGQMSVLQPYVDNGSINIVYDQYVSHWSAGEGYDKMKECLRKTNNNVDAVIAANDEIASGITAALKEVHLDGRIYLCGQDAELAAIQRIVAGTQAMTVYKPIEAIATVAAKTSMDIIRNKLTTNIPLSVNNGKILVPSILLPAMSVNKETIKLTVIADGYLKENKIYEHAD